MSEKIVSGFGNRLSWYLKEVINEIKCVGICKYTFLIFQKGYKRKNCVRVFKVCKYTFLIFKKWDKLKKFVRICQYTSFNDWKRW